MTAEEKPLEFEDLVNLSYEDVRKIYNSDYEDRIHFKRDSEPRHALETAFWERRDIKLVIKEALEKLKPKLTEDMVRKIGHAIDNGTHNIPQFSREVQFNGRQYRTGGGYYEELIFMPGGIVISSFVKRYGQKSDFWKTVQLHKAMDKIKNIGRFIVGSPARDHQNLAVTYSHACFGGRERNLADKVKGKTYDEASAIIKKAIDVNLELAAELTKNKKNFEKPFEEQLFTGQRYFFDTIKSIDKIIDKALGIIAPEIPSKEKRKIKGLFKKVSRNDRLYVVHGDAQLQNIVEEDGRFKMCDFDYFNYASIHRLLVRLLEKSGPAQLGEMDFVEYAYEKLCQIEGRNVDEKEKKRFMTRYLYEKPAENLLRAARTIEHIEQTPLGENEENRKKLEEIALIYYNRALRNLDSIGEYTIRHEIINETNHRLLRYLDDAEYFWLEGKNDVNDHGYTSMLLFQDIQKGLGRYEEEEKPFLRKVWEFLRGPIAVGVGASIILGSVALIARSCKEKPFDFEKELKSPYMMERISKELAKSKYDYGILFGDFDGDIRAEEDRVARYLDDYMFAAENDSMVMPHEDYERFFANDSVERSKAANIGQNWNTAIYRISGTQGNPRSI